MYLVVLLLPLLQGPDLFLPEIVLPLPNTNMAFAPLSYLVSLMHTCHTSLPSSLFVYLVVLLLLLLQGPDLVLPEVILPLHGVLECLVVLLELLVVSPERLDLGLPLSIGPDQPHEGVLQLDVEVVAVVKGGLHVGFHGWKERRRMWV